MFLKTIILLPTFYFLAVFQSSFLSHFDIFGWIVSPAFILIVFLIFFIPSLSFASAFWGGIFLDIFSPHFFGLYVMILLGIAFFLKLIFKKYVQFSF